MNERQEKDSQDFTKCQVMRILLFIMMAFLFNGCTTLNGIKSIQSDVYLVPAGQFQELTGMKPEHGQKAKVNLIAKDSGFVFSSLSDNFPDKSVEFLDVKRLTLYKYTLDIDILTIPFKIRPSVKGFPTQLNPNFSAALYLGKRIDRYNIQRRMEYNKPVLNVKAAGFGFGIFTGPGTVTMNPFVTRNAINFEYDGFVMSGGFAGIYDAKRFNLGLAVGMDYLVDKNRKEWIYQNKPWIGILFGLNLN